MKYLITLLSLVLQLSVSAEKLKVCATVTDMADLVRVIGGDQVEVTTFAPAVGDPHFVIAKPNFIKSLSKADMYIQTGFELESGWAPVLLKGCRNAKVQPNAIGHIDPSNVIKPLFELKGRLTRADGHVHPEGNPHYMMDPVNGLIVAYLINSRLKVIRPEKAEYFNENTKKFQDELITKLIGKKLASKYSTAKLARLIKIGKLEKFLELSKQENDLGGWLGKFKAKKNKKFYADHANYIYLVERFGMEVVGYLEPKPGMDPTTAHLMKLVKDVPTLSVQGILANSYFPAKYGQMIAKKAKLPIVKLAHQVGSMKGAETYLKMIDFNVNQILKAYK